VFIGLVCTYFGFPLGDPLGAMGVAIIVLVMTIKLGRETIDHLLDRAPQGFTESICSAVEGLEGVMSCGRIRVRKAGAITFADVEIHIDPNLPVERAQQIGERVKLAVKEVVGSADVTVSMHAGYKAYPYLVSSIRKDVNKFDRIKDVHSIHAFEFGDYAWVVLDIGVSETETLQEAHQIASDFEEYLLNTYASIKEVTTHIEPVAAHPTVVLDLEKARRKVCSLVEESGFFENCHDVEFFALSHGTFSVTLHCNANPNLSIKQVHQATIQLEHRIREEILSITHIVIHVEPKNGESTSSEEQ
jgi:divalent metal cation (Fe/Co/Zn/Cd) transporter